MKSSAHSPETKSPELQISSLIDICFLLLVFFLVTSTLVANEQGLNSSLPTEVETPQVTKAPPLQIEVDARGIISVNHGSSRQVLDTDAQVREVPLLTQRLETFSAMSRASNFTPTARIKVHQDTSYQRVVDVLNALQGQNITKIALEAGETEQPSKP